MRKILVLAAVAAVCFLAVGQSLAAPISVTIPDPSPNPFIYFGNGDASVTYSGVNFAQQAALSDGGFFNVGVLFSGFPAVLSSQEQNIGVANILVSLPSPSVQFSVNYDTFFGSPVTFELSNGASFTLGSTANNYDASDFFGVGSSVAFNWVLITSSDFVLNINNITYTPSTPEPGTLVMLASGLLAVGGVVRRKLMM
jgi:hypothetical protein